MAGSILLLGFSKKVKKLRKHHNFTKEELAKKLGISTLDLYLVECGKRFVSIDELNRLSSIFKVSLDYLCNEYSDYEYDPELKYLVYSFLDDEQKLFLMQLMNRIKTNESSYHDHRFFLDFITLYMNHFGKKQEPQSDDL